MVSTYVVCNECGREDDYCGYTECGGCCTKGKGVIYCYICVNRSEAYVCRMCDRHLY